MYYKLHKSHTKESIYGGIMMATKETVKMQQLTLKLKVDDLNRLKEYADKKGGNPVSHYIREAVSEFLENHYK